MAFIPMILPTPVIMYMPTYHQPSRQPYYVHKDMNKKGRNEDDNQD